MIRAMHEWIIDSDLTPYALVDANHSNVVIPEEFIEDGKILLNVSPSATQNLNLGNEFILFNARFNGVPMEVSFPISAVMAIYAKENGRGMMFKDDELTSDSELLDSSMESSRSEPDSHSRPSPSKPISINIVGSDKNDSDDDNDPDDDPPGSVPPKKPSLKIVK